MSTLKNRLEASAMVCTQRCRTHGACAHVVVYSSMDGRTATRLECAVCLCVRSMVESLSGERCCAVEGTRWKRWRALRRQRAAARDVGWSLRELTEFCRSVLAARPDARAQWFSRRTALAARAVMSGSVLAILDVHFEWEEVGDVLRAIRCTDEKFLARSADANAAAEHVDAAARLLEDRADQLNNDAPADQPLP